MASTFINEVNMATRPANMKTKIEIMHCHKMLIDSSATTTSWSFWDAFILVSSDFLRPKFQQQKKNLKQKPVGNERYRILTKNFTRPAFTIVVDVIRRLL
uniref:Uncharacterized protein n=1 Tax=Romanomermis culicivorax TaxID=13658 RepID=A0A915K5Q3_ROMCU